MSNFIPHIKTANNVTVYLDGKPHVVSVGTAQYDLVIDAIDAGDIEAAKDAINIRQAVVNKAGGRISLDGTTLLYDGRPLHGALVNRIIGVVQAAGDASPLLLFLENLMENPSKRATDELYDFMDACSLPITDDGHFLAYKKVRADYKDCHSGTMDNSVGQVLTMPRNAVDEDKNRTCSAGLHFCSKSYLSSFGGARVVVVKINPRDVVAIPSDYNNAKGRTCRYEVIDELDVSAGTDSDSVESIRDNYEDKYAGQGTAATQPGKNSLTDAQVREIRNLLDDDWAIAGIARAVGTSARTVARIRDGETYTHVK